jgi:DNA-binding response OmpR family regulator
MENEETLDMRLDTGSANLNLAPASAVPPGIFGAFATSPKMMVLSDDALEIEALQKCAEALSMEMMVFANGQELMTDLVRDGNGGFATPEQEQMSLLVLGGNLPGWVLRYLLDRLRESFCQGRSTLGSALLPPVIFLPALGNLADVASEIVQGANVDFVTKPFIAEEFVVRANMLKRKQSELMSVTDLHFVTNGAEPAIEKPQNATDSTRRYFLNLKKTANHERPEFVEFGQYRFFPHRKIVAIQGKGDVKLSGSEFEVGWMLFCSTDRLVSREEMVNCVQSNGFLRATSDSRILDAIVSRIRKKLELTVESGFVVKPVYGVGYILNKI